MEQDNKKIYFDDISPIRGCLDDCDKCLGYYIFVKLEAYSICYCTCHQILLTFKNIEPIILSIQEDKDYKKGHKGYSNLVKTPKNSTFFNTIEEIFSRSIRTRCQG